MAFHLTTEGAVTEITPEKEYEENATERVIASKDEWESVAGEWPLKRLVAIWNGLPGVTPVEKFTSRPIALERIWRAVEFPEHARRETPGRSGKAKLQFREGSKAAQAYSLLCRPEGVTVRELQDLTGWQRHTVRGFLSASVRKQGSRVRSFQRAGERVYRVRS
jgi:Protein of unknown function (DUF3489)